MLGLKSGQIVGCRYISFCKLVFLFCPLQRFAYLYVVKRAVDFRDLEMITHEQIFEETDKQECNNLISLMNVVGT